jgi:two-component system sensor histidine kinase UhpB
VRSEKANPGSPFLRAARQVDPAQSRPMSARRAPFQRLAARAWHVLVIGVVAAIGSALAAAAEMPTLIIDHALAAASADSRFPATESLVDTALPDHWSQSRPGYGGGVWYRAGFRLGGNALPDDLLGLYVERACSNLQVHLNGALIFSGGRMQEPVTRNCSRPQLITLPPALLRPQENVLDFRVQGHPLERAASRQEAGGLSRVELGLQSNLAQIHAGRLLWGPTWIEASSLILIGLGCVLVAVGLLNSREVYFSYLGWLCLAWAVLSLAAHAHDMPWDNDVSEFMLCSSWAVLLALAVQFFLSFAGLRSRTIENLIALQWVLLPLSLVLAGPTWLFAIGRAWYFLLALELAFVMGIYLVVTRRQRPQDFAPMVLAIAAGSLALLTELGVQAGLLEPPAVSVAQIVVPLLFAAVGTRLFLMFARALQATEVDRNRLATQLQRLTAEFDSRVEHLTAQRVEQFTERERKRIASDLHDDLGAKLLTIVHTSDGARIPQLAREALEEMRLSVRGLAGKPVRLDDALADWRAETMVRLGQAKIEAAWEHPDDGVSQMLPARVFMQLTRVLREAVSNVIKHSAATHCQVRCLVVDGALQLMVKDDGRGIAADLHRGQGMSSMKRRAKKMNGQCLVESRPGYGVVISLTVPL